MSMKKMWISIFCVLVVVIYLLLLEVVVDNGEGSTETDS